MTAKEWRSTDSRWLVVVAVTASNIDDIPTDDDQEDEIYPGDSVPSDRILANCFIWEDGKISVPTVLLDQYTKNRLSRTIDTLDMLKIMAHDTKIRRKLLNIRNIINEVINE